MLLAWLSTLPGELIHSQPELCIFLGHAHFSAGNTDTAEQVLIDAAQTFQASGKNMAGVNARHYLAQFRGLQGRLHEAREIDEQAIEFTGKGGTTVYSGVEYVGLGELLSEWNQLDAAAVEIQKGLELAEAARKYIQHVSFSGCSERPGKLY